ncbi:MAG: hypothetical protein J5J06_19380 [Phycisphaerae bacterium]|nr:hypothetical protein [Phycisphaerae bacterium]
MPLQKCAQLSAIGLIALWGACTPSLPPDIGSNTNSNFNTNDNTNANDGMTDPNQNDNDSMTPDEPQPAPDALPDFSLTDVNPASARTQQPVSPRDYLGQVSAWYFGHST